MCPSADARCTDGQDARPTRRPGGVKYVSFREQSGYGVSARRFIRTLVNSGVAVTWTPMVGGTPGPLWYRPYLGSRIDDAELEPLCNREIPYSAVILHLVPEYYPAWADRERGKTVIGCTVWETTRIPQHWAPLLNGVGRVVVPCTWNLNVLRECGVVRPIDVIPYVYYPPIEPAVAQESGDTGDFVFYTVGVWSDRKAVWNTIRAYLTAFTAADPVVLVIKTSRRDSTRRVLPSVRPNAEHSLRRIVRRFKNPARIILVDRDVPDAEMVRMLVGCDCYVSLCRSEGWGLDAFDAAGLGKPVIITGFGGQLDYLPRDDAYLVDYDMIRVRAGRSMSSYTSDQSWAEPRVSHGAELMRRVFEHPNEGRERGRRLRAHVRERFGERSVAPRLLGLLGGC